MRLALKQGALLALDMLITDDNGQPVDLSDSTVTIVIADPLGALLASIPVDPSTEQGFGRISVSTDGWPVGRVVGEVRVAQGGAPAPVISDSFFIEIERAAVAS
jgi:hypothetical protein